MEKAEIEFQDKLVRGLTHRMNNILSLFHGYVGLLMEGKQLDRETRDGLERIRKGACAASELMERTRALAQPSSIIWREVKLPDFFQTIRMETASEFPKNVALEIDCPAELPKLWTDASRLRTAIVELVKNAAEAAAESDDPSGGRVAISVGGEDRSGGEHGTQRAQPMKWLTIAVKDNGPGVPATLADRIFDPFFTTHNHNTAGLGLTVAAGLARQFGGTVDFTSEPGETVFRFSLPLRTEE
jgi:nitrogen-specific signal transduction histidine kinase